MVHGKNHPLIVMVGPILCLTCALYLGFDQDFERGFLWRIRKLFDWTKRGEVGLEENPREGEGEAGGNSFIQDQL